ncbi:unnamed protein product [Symbiodinium natans]|uniref:Uncharacterized protein n=1 Tax=Symbiodinium natans TaxID=878477 RepID=A0A812LF04_9DINO|nr:unnamed protein product [Symbiodinium natans]
MTKSSLLSGVMLVAFLGSSLSFVGLRAAPRQESRTALRGQAGASATPWTPVLSRDVVEIEFTAPAQGARCRFMIKADADVSEVLSEGRKRLGFDQAWMPDSDFKIYNSEDEEAGPLKAREWKVQEFRDGILGHTDGLKSFLCCVGFGSWDESRASVAGARVQCFFCLTLALA